MKDRAQLVERAKKGDLAAFGRLVDAYRRAAYAIAYSRLGNADDAQDAAQEAFIEAFLGLQSLREAESFGAWLATMVRRQSSRITERNHSQARMAAEQMRVVSPVVHETGLLDSLSEIDREILSLNVLAGYTYSEIGCMLSMSAGAIKSRMHRAKGRLLKEAITMDGTGLPDSAFTKNTIERLLIRLASAGQPLSAVSLGDIARETDAPELAEIARGLASLVEQGQSVGGAMFITRLIPGGMYAIFRLGADLGKEGEALRVAGQLLREGLIQPESPISSRDAGDFCAHLACLFPSGIPVLQAIDLAGKQIPSLEGFAAELREEVRSGGRMADCFEKTRDVFSGSFAAIVRMAEGSNGLETAFSILATALWHPEFLDTTQMTGDWAERMKHAEGLLQAWSKR